MKMTKFGWILKDSLEQVGPLFSSTSEARKWLSYQRNILIYNNKAVKISGALRLVVA